MAVIERLNARELEPANLPFAPGFVTADVSFISLAKVLPAITRCLEPGSDVLALVKPQFELERGRVGKGGVVRSNETRARVVREVAEAALGWDAQTAGVVDSGLPGPKGNRELFLHLVQSPKPALPDELDEWIDAAVG